jgi:hypothetical protein
MPRPSIPPEDRPSPRFPIEEQPSTAFPIEAIFPGTHARRPDIAEAEAEVFLAHGSSPPGFSLADPDIVRWLTDPAREFIDFQIAPVPSEWAALIATQLGGYEWHDKRADGVAATLTADLAWRVPGLRPDLEIRILEEKEPWVCQRS